MRILFTRFPLESADGGAENQTLWLMEGLRARGYTIQYIGSCPVLLERTRELKIENVQLKIGPPPVTKYSAMSFLWRKPAMKKALIRGIESLPQKPDAIFMLSLTEKLLLTDYVAAQGIKIFWIEHDRIGSWLQWNPWLRALKRAAEHATIICVSDISRKLYLKMGFDEKKVISILNGVPVVLPSSGEGLGVGELRVGTVARLDREKGIDILIQSIAELPEVTLSILGKGREESYIRTLIDADTQRIGQQRIHLLSHVPDLSAFYYSLDIFVLPSSDHDPFGLVAAEAMMCGTATIVTDACGISASLTCPDEALVVPARSPQELSIAIRTLFDQGRREELAANGKKAAQSRFTIEVMVEKYEQILHKL